MKLEFILTKTEDDLRMYPQGFYWHAYTDNHSHDADGSDALTAAVELATKLEAEVTEWTGGK